MKNICGFASKRNSATRTGTELSRKFRWLIHSSLTENKLRIGQPFIQADFWLWTGLVCNWDRSLCSSGKFWMITLTRCLFGWNRSLYRPEKSDFPLQPVQNYAKHWIGSFVKGSILGCEDISIQLGMRPYMNIWKNVWVDLFKGSPSPFTIGRLAHILLLPATFNDFLWPSSLAIWSSQDQHSCSMQAYCSMGQGVWRTHDGCIWVHDTDADLIPRLCFIYGPVTASHLGRSAQKSAHEAE